MKSRLIPGRIRPISFIFVIPLVILSLTIGLVIAQISFNLAVDYRLHQLESQISPIEVETGDSGEVILPDEQTPDTNPETSSLLQTEAEREMIERVVMAEAMGEPFEGQVAVAQTILDRAVLWNMTPVEVVSQDSQYADMHSGEISQSVREAVAAVFDYGCRAFEEPTTHFATFEPWWAKEKVNRGSIGRHIFWGD